MYNVDMDIKTCSECEADKPIGEFNYSRPGVLRGNCKKCQYVYTKRYLKKNPEKVSQFALNRKPKSKVYRQKTKEHRNAYMRAWGKQNPEKTRAQKYRHRYGIDIEDYDELLGKQDGKCAICYSSDFGRANAKYFVVDHCHKTKKVRGLLCHKCNVVIGISGDNTNILKQAIDYLVEDLR